MSDLGNKAIMAENIKYYMDLNNKSRNDMCEALDSNTPPLLIG